MTLRSFIVLLGALVGVAATVRLGWWQLDRAAQKTALQRSIDDRAAQPALSQAQLARGVGELPGQLNRTVALRGHWSPGHTVFLDNRPLHGRPGFIIITPLDLGDGTAVLVQRGWAPRDAFDRTRLPHVTTPSDGVELRGRIAGAPSRLFEFDSTAAGPIRQNLDIDAFAREARLELRPLTVLQTEGGADGLDRDWPQPAVDSHKNLGYALQWFSIAALIAGLYVWFRIVRPRFRAR